MIQEVRPLYTQALLFYELSKPGIVLFVVLCASSGYLLGYSFLDRFPWSEWLFTIAGLLSLSAGCSALNHYQEREADQKMKRTCHRPLPSGKMGPHTALCYALTLIGTGLYLLFFLSFTLGSLGVLALLSYNGLYTLWWKKNWAHAAIPGAIPGALPILIGHIAAQKNIFHPTGWYWFWVLFVWQMPHFWTLALHYRHDYAQAGFPTLPVQRGPFVTHQHILLWGLAYVGLLSLAPLFSPLGAFYTLPGFWISLQVLQELRRFYRTQKQTTASSQASSPAWLRFFLWINASLLIYLGLALADHGITHLWPHWQAHLGSQTLQSLPR